MHNDITRLKMINEIISKSGSTEYLKTLREKLIERNNKRVFDRINNDDLPSKRSRNEYGEAFKELCSYIFAGFDYYYASNVGTNLKNHHTFQNYPRQIDVLINVEHLDKLKNVIESSPNLSFVDYNNQQIITYKDSSIYFRLVPFIRNEDNSLSFNVDGRNVSVGAKELESFVGKNEDYEELEYKKLSLKGLRLEKGRKKVSDC